METLIRKEIMLEGLCCANCAAKIENGAAKLDGVQSASIDLIQQKLVLTMNRESSFNDCVKGVKAIANRIEPDVKVFVAEDTHGHSHGHSHDHAHERSEGGGLRRNILAGIGVVLFIIGVTVNLGTYAELAVFIASYILIGGGVILRAGRGILRGQVFDENFLMTLATFGAFAIGDYPEAVAVMLFYRVGEFFQEYAVGRSRRSITQLMDIRPDFANLKTDGGTERVSPSEVLVGQMIVVKPGERVPLDGIVRAGNSALDTSALTGESLPRDCAPGQEVLSGCVNINGLLTIEVTKPFGESTVSKILDLVQNASGNKARAESFITRFARYYTPIVVFAAAGLAFIPPLILGGGLADWVYRALVFLVVSCPCALVISIPLSFFGGIGGAARRGILVKGSNFLDALNNVGTVVFDKTGTLTKGEFSVTEICPAYGFTESRLLELAAAAESASNHPIAKSIVKAYGKPARVADEYEEIAGLGVRAVIGGRTVIAGNAAIMDGVTIERYNPSGTAVYISVDGTYAGHIAIADTIKPDSASAIAALRSLGVRNITMLTGDTKAAGERIGRELGLSAVYSELLPQDKVAHLERMMEQHTDGKLLFVGDGINDAPVLARADVGIAMGGAGSDAAIEAADIVLMTDEPSRIADAICVAKRTRGIVIQNIIFSFIIKALFLVLGAMGVASMWEAVFGDVGVALICILNAMRVLSKKTGNTRILNEKRG